MYIHLIIFIHLRERPQLEHHGRSYYFNKFIGKHPLSMHALNALIYMHINPSLYLSIALSICGATVRYPEPYQVIVYF